MLCTRRSCLRRQCVHGALHLRQSEWLASRCIILACCTAKLPCSTASLQARQPHGMCIPSAAVLINDYVLTVGGRTKVTPYLNTVVGGKVGLACKRAALQPSLCRKRVNT